MEFIEHYLEGVNTPVLVPPHFRLLNMMDGSIQYRDEVTQEISNDEPLIHHDGELVFLNQYRTYFPSDEVIVLLRTQSGNLVYQRRSYNKLWEPGKMDMVSVAGQVRAVLLGDRFVSEGYDEAAVRELSEETGLPQALFRGAMQYMGAHYNALTDSYQQVYCSVFNESLAFLNAYSKEHSDQEVDEWFEGDYHNTLDYYSGAGAHEHAGGAEIFNTCFIANPAIRAKLSEYFST